MTTNDFTFNDRPYRLVFRDSGMSAAPDDPVYIGEVHLFAGEVCVAKFSLIKDIMTEFSEWEYVDVIGLHVGDWMQDVLDMAEQIDANHE